MATQTGAPDEQQLKKRAMRRLAVALTLIALAIAGLALLDRYNASLKKPELATGPAEPRGLPSEPAMPQPSSPEPPSAVPAPEHPPKPSETPAVSKPVHQPPPPPPVVTNEPLTPTESARPAPKATAAAPVDTQPAMKPVVPTVEKPPPAKAAVPKEVEAPVPAKSAEVPGARGFVVQVGVFGTAENARDLQAKLTEKGIPSSTETRVVVGPFQGRAEAEAVNAKLKEMGLQGMIVTPR